VRTTADTVRMRLRLNAFEETITTGRRKPGSEATGSGSPPTTHRPVPSPLLGRQRPGLEFPETVRGRTPPRRRSRRGVPSPADSAAGTGNPRGRPRTTGSGTLRDASRGVRRAENLVGDRDGRFHTCSMNIVIPDVKPVLYEGSVTRGRRSALRCPGSGNASPFRYNPRKGTRAIRRRRIQAGYPECLLNEGESSRRSTGQPSPRTTQIGEDGR